MIIHPLSSYVFLIILLKKYYLLQDFEHLYIVVEVLPLPLALGHTIMQCSTLLLMPDEKSMTILFDKSCEQTDTSLFEFIVQDFPGEHTDSWQ